ncbi:unnamed protein product [Calypogeia fissa]
MGDHEPEIQESAEAHDVQPLAAAEGVDHQGCRNETITIPFFPLFVDNLAPRYRPSLSSDRPQSRIASFSQDFNLPLKPDPSPTTGLDIQGRKSTIDGDGAFNATVNPENVVPTKPLTADRSGLRDTPDSSRRGIQDAATMLIDSDEVTSTWKPLVGTSSASAMASTSSAQKEACGFRRTSSDPAIGGQDNWVQAQSMDPKSSTGSTPVHVYRAPNHTMTPTLRDLQHGKENECEDRRSSSEKLSSTSKRWWLEMEMGFTDFPRISTPVLPSWRDLGYGYDQIVFPTVHTARWLAALERRRGLRGLLSPVGFASRSKEAKDKALFTLKQWHQDLELDNPACPIIASHIFFRAFRVFQRTAWPRQMDKSADYDLEFRARVLMATAFWVSAKIVDTLNKIPSASAMATTASITAHSLICTELPMLDALEWKLVAEATERSVEFLNDVHDSYKETTVYFKRLECEHQGFRYLDLVRAHLTHAAGVLLAGSASADRGRAWARELLEGRGMHFGYLPKYVRSP